MIINFDAIDRHMERKVFGYQIKSLGIEIAERGFIAFWDLVAEKFTY